MRRALVAAAVGALALIGPASTAGATHTGGGCPHGVTSKAHATVPHRTHGNHNAHQRIPYCPPHDAPRHKDAGGHEGH